MVVYCPGCGAKIDALPSPNNPYVQCPRCQSKFSTAGVKAAPDAPPRPALRKKKKPGRGKFVGVFIFLLVLLVLGGGTAGVLYYTGAFGPRSSGSSSISEGTAKTGPSGKVVTDGWKELAPSEAKFRALLPGSPRRKERNERVRGSRVRDVEFAAEQGDVVYQVVYANMDQTGLRSLTPEQFIDQQRQQLAGSSKLVGEKDVTAGPYKGKEFEVDVPGQGRVYMRFFAAGRRLYSVAVAGKGRSPDPAEVAAFFDSFQILD
jgi:hypothetical protein